MTEEHLYFLNTKLVQCKLAILDIVYKTGKGHIGGTYSIVDLLVYLYYTQLLVSDPILIGKGHSCLASYVIWEDLKLITPEMLDSFGENGAILGSQFDINTSIYNTGSLGHVIGVGAGYALASKILNDNKKIYVIVGDGECEEGSIWESIDFCVKNNLENLVIVVDNNKLSVTHRIENNRLKEKFEGFGAECFEIDGHNFQAIDDTFARLKDCNSTPVIIMNTVKGKGVSFMENDTKWHQGILTSKQYIQAKGEICLK